MASHPLPRSALASDPASTSSGALAKKRSAANSASDSTRNRRAGPDIATAAAREILAREEARTKEQRGQRAPHPAVEGKVAARRFAHEYPRGRQLQLCFLAAGGAVFARHRGVAVAARARGRKRGGVQEKGGFGKHRTARAGSEDHEARGMIADGPAAALRTAHISGRNGARILRRRSPRAHTDARPAAPSPSPRARWPHRPRRRPPPRRARHRATRRRARGSLR